MYGAVDPQLWCQLPLLHQLAEAMFCRSFDITSAVRYWSVTEPHAHDTKGASAIVPAQNERAPAPTHTRTRAHAHTEMVYVTAVYDLYGGAIPISDMGALAARLAVLAQSLWPLHVFCDPGLQGQLLSALADAAGHVVVTPLALEATETAEVFRDVTDLPPNRNHVKDTKGYMTLMCAKTEFMRLAKDAHPEATGVVWVDAGITKILVPAEAPLVLQTVAERVDILLQLGLDRIVVPGCWSWPRPFSGHPSELAHGICWRFCGGFVVAPAGLVERFAREVLRGCSLMASATGRVTWEVNVWALVEHALPIEWHYGDHNASIFDCVRAAILAREV